MAKYGMNGYFRFDQEDFKDPTLFGLWNLIGKAVYFDSDYRVMHHSFDKAFTQDPIAFELLSSIIRKNVNADKILVRQMFNNGPCNSEIQKVLNVTTTNPELILASNSQFASVISDAEYGMDVWIWDFES